MCGLVTILAESGGQLLDAGALERMTDKIEHRGPDDHGYAYIGAEDCRTWRAGARPALGATGVAMGHRRLSILDLSEAGRQPFTSADQRYWMVYNGEIYNFVELRESLRGLGHTFSTGTDTEVLLAAFAHWGTGCFNRLNGMWALTILDRRDGTLTVSRDRFGIKPLYYHRHGDGWLFASEVKALLAHPCVPAAPDERTLFDYLQHNTYPSGEETLFKGISAVLPGTFMQIRDGRASTSRYYQLPPPDDAPIGKLSDAVEQFGTLFHDSVRLRARADVRVGTMLSGGLDSTSVISTITRQLSTDRNVRTAVGDTLFGFNASFPGTPIDETDKVDELCSALKLTAHKVFPIEEQNVAELLAHSNRAMELPYGSSIPMVNTMLMRRARAEGVIVVLNGHGADEMFAGYSNHHCALAAADRLRRLRLGGFFGEIRGMVEHHGYNWRWATASALEYILPWQLTPRNAHTDQSVVDGMLQSQPLARLGQSAATPRVAGRSQLDQTLRHEFLQAILPRWLHMEDRISMSASVEARLPFLDYRVVELAFSLDNALRVNNGTTKYLLRTAMRDHLPSSIVSDQRKFFFPGPNVHWLANQLQATVRDKLAGAAPSISEYIKPAALQSLVGEFEGGQHGKARLIWRFLNAEIWHRTFFANA